MLKAVGFDIDGTLYPEMQIWRRSLLFALRHMRVLRAFSRTRKRMRSSGKNDGESELRFLASELHSSVETARSIRDTIIYKGWEKRFRGVKTYPGVREALIRLKSAGIRLAVLSDFPVGRKLEYFGLADLFDAALGFPESGSLKPGNRGFLMMAEHLGVEPDNMLYVGNKLDYDVYGAERCGMRGVLIGTRGRKIPDGVTVFADYRHLADALLREVT